MSLQRIAFAHLLGSTIWAPRSLATSANMRLHSVLMQLSLWTLLAMPMHKLVAAKGGVVGMNAICNIALIIPFKQQWVLRCFICWLLCLPSHSYVTATRASTVVMHTLFDGSLPLVAADWTLPLSPEITAGKHLLRCLHILVMIPVLCLFRCFGSKRAVLTDCFPLTIRAFGAPCAASHTCLPVMRASCWTVGA